jgi:HAD superfamily hydrolase (TIGR01509 family)
MTATEARPVRAVTFDYGQTLAELDTAFLAQRALEWGAAVESSRLEAASPTAWAAYDDAKRSGETGYGAWSKFMATLLAHAGTVSRSAPGREVTAELVDYLWSEQPRKNLWRRPIAGMAELVEGLADRGVPLGIVSNSEGHLSELLEEMSLRRYFRVVADSGKLGFEKPDRRIFDFAAEGLGVAADSLVHVGDAWVADIEGALHVGAKAIWVADATNGKALPAGVARCHGAGEIRSALRALGIPA